MPTLPTVSTLMDAVMNELRIPVSNLTERTKIQSVMSYVYGDICAKQDWWWLVRKTTEFTFGKPDGVSFESANPDITASVTFASPTVTLSSAPSGTAVTFMMNGAVIVFNNGVPANTYRTTTTYGATGGTTLPLDGLYVGPSTSGLTFKTYRDYFFISDVMAKVLRVTCIGSPYDLQKIGIEDMARLRQQPVRTGRPEYWSVYEFSTLGDPSSNRRIWYYPYPDDNYPVEVWYKHQSAGDLSDISIPIDYQQVLVYGTLARAYTIFLNDTERGSFFTSLFNDVMALMAAQQREYASDHPGVNPQPSAYRRTSRRFPYATSLGRLFDTYPYRP